MTLKISISGIRGIVDQSLTPEICLDFAKAFGTLINGGPVVVGLDPRVSSEFIKGLVIEGLISAGCRVVDLGICPTPTVGLMVREVGAKGGVIITASHNPQEWNGLKFVRDDGIFLNQSQGEELIRLYKSRQYLAQAGGRSESFTQAGDIHIKKILKNVNVSAIRSKKFKVALDSCNGAGSLITPKLLKELGCEVIEINCTPNGTFPRGAEPTPENTGDLQNKVKETGAQIGFAQDPDADRLAFVDEQGNPVSEEYTLVLCAKHLLAKSAGPKVLVANLSTTLALDAVAKQFGAIVIRTRIGEVHVAEEMKRSRALVGGEGNGGVIFPRVGFNRDSLSGIALILEMMAIKKMPLSQIIAEFPVYYTDKRKIICPDQHEAELLIARAKEIYKNQNLDLTEGVKVILNNSWIHVRASNTEPIVRVFAEAGDPETARRLTSELMTKLAV